MSDDFSQGLQSDNNFTELKSQTIKLEITKIDLMNEYACLLSHRQHRKRPMFKKPTIALTIFVATCAVLASLTYMGFFKEKSLAFDDMENYAKTLIVNYNQSISFFLPAAYGQFAFYSNCSYAVTAIKSSNFGTAMIFYPSANWSFKAQSSNLRIEDAVFGADNSRLPVILNMVGTGVAFYGINFPFMTNIGFIVGNDSTMIFRDITINTVPYYCLIIKGSNTTSNWSSASAQNDSRLIFDSDLCQALNVSEEVRERYAEPELNEDLLKILQKWSSAFQPNSSLSYTYTQKEYDIQQVEEKARTKYGITNSSEFVDNLLRYLEYVTMPSPPPQKTIFGRPVDDPDNWLYVTCLGSLPILDFAFFLIVDQRRKKRPSALAKWLFTIPTAILAVVLIDLLYYYPYDYQVVSVQTVVVITMWILGPVIYKSRRKLVEVVYKKNKS